MWNLVVKLRIKGLALILTLIKMNEKCSLFRHTWILKCLSFFGFMHYFGVIKIVMLLLYD
uniref:Uncharacterized protein n=1 Tax=Solanum lycopersicum TaxID=4081 RepID=A0A3Q7EWW5_SOLLC